MMKTERLGRRREEPVSRQKLELTQIFNSRVAAETLDWNGPTKRNLVPSTSSDCDAFSVPLIMKSREATSPSFTCRLCVMEGTRKGVIG